VRVKPAADKSGISCHGAGHTTVPLKELVQCAGNSSVKQTPNADRNQKRTLPCLRPWPGDACRAAKGGDGVVLLRVSIKGSSGGGGGFFMGTSSWETRVWERGAGAGVLAPTRQEGSLTPSW